MILKSKTIEIKPTGKAGFDKVKVVNLKTKNYDD